MNVNELLERYSCGETNFEECKLVSQIIRDKDLKYANFRKADFHGTNLRKTDLSDSNLDEAELVDVVLIEANLSNASLRGTNLIRASLRNANLSNANLRGANLYKATLVNANLYGTDLRDAKNLNHANLMGANYDKKTLFPDYYNPENNGCIYLRNIENEELIESNQTQDSVPNSFLRFIENLGQYSKDLQADPNFIFKILGCLISILLLFPTEILWRLASPIVSLIQTIFNKLISQLKKTKNILNNERIKKIFQFILIFILASLLFLIPNNLIPLYFDVQVDGINKDINKEHVNSEEIKALDKVIKLVDSSKYTQQKLSGFPVNFSIQKPSFLLKKIIDNIYQKNVVKYEGDEINHFSISKKGEVAASDENGNISIWNTSGIKRNSQKSEQIGIKSLTFSNNDKYIVTGGEDGSVIRWETEHLDKLDTLIPKDKNRKWIKSLRYPNDQILIATAGNGAAYLKNIDSSPKLIELKHVQKSTTSTKNIYSADYNTKCQIIATAGGDGTVQFWDLNGNNLKKPLFTNQDVIYALHYSSDGEELATVGKAGTLKIWSLHNCSIKHPVEIGSEKVFDGPKNNLLDKMIYLDYIDDLHFPNDTDEIPRSRFIVGVYDGGLLKIYDDSNIVNSNNKKYIKSQPLIIKSDFNDRIKAPSFSLGFHNSAQQLLVAATKSKNFVIWNFKNLKSSKIKEINRDVPIKKVIVRSSNDDPELTLDTVVLDDNGKVSLITRTGQEITTLNDLKKVNAISFYPVNNKHNRFVIADNVGNVYLMSSSGKEIDNLGDPKNENGGPFENIVFSGNGHFVLMQDRKSLIVRKVQDKKTQFKVPGLSDDDISLVSINDNGDKIAAYSLDNKIHFWSPNKSPQSFSNPSNYELSSIIFSPNEQLAISTEKDSKIIFLNTNGKQARGDLETDQQGVSSIAYIRLKTESISNQFFHRNFWLATAGLDGTIKLWDSNYNLITELDHNLRDSLGEIKTLSFSNDGKKLIAGGSSGFVKKWELEGIDELIQKGCNWLKDYNNIANYKTESGEVCKSKSN